MAPEKAADLEAKRQKDWAAATGLRKEFTGVTKEFDLQDIINITGIGVSTKRDEDIGIFGIGFKSVYYIHNLRHARRN